VTESSLTGIELRLQPRELVRHWQRCGQTADWISSYLVHDVEPSAKAHLKNVFSTVINELLENAVKFSTPGAPDITLAAGHHGTFIRIETRNVTSDARAERLGETLEALGQSALDSLFARRVAMGSDADAPGVGLLIIKRDYGARVRAVLTPRTDGARDVQVIVELDLAARPV
jgi:hypothetical protein